MTKLNKLKAQNEMRWLVNLSAEAQGCAQRADLMARPALREVPLARQLSSARDKLTQVGEPGCLRPACRPLHNKPSYTRDLYIRD